MLCMEQCKAGTPKKQENGRKCGVYPAFCCVICNAEARKLFHGPEMLPGWPRGPQSAPATLGHPVSRYWGTETTLGELRGHGSSRAGLRSCLQSSLLSFTDLNQAAIKTCDCTSHKRDHREERKWAKLIKLDERQEKKRVWKSHLGNNFISALHSCRTFSMQSAGALIHPSSDHHFWGERMKVNVFFTTKALLCERKSRHLSHCNIFPLRKFN